MKSTYFALLCIALVGCQESNQDTVTGQQFEGNREAKATKAIGDTEARGAIDIQLQPPIVVTGCAVADSASALDFRDSSGKQYSLLIDYPELHEDGVLSLSTGSQGGIGSLLERGSPLAEQICHALDNFVKSTATPEQLKDLTRRSQIEEEIESITEQEWALLEAVSFIHRLKEDQPTRPCNTPKDQVSTADEAQRVAAEWMEKQFGDQPDPKINPPYGTVDKGDHWGVCASSIDGTGDGIVVKVDKKTGTVELNAPTKPGPRGGPEMNRPNGSLNRATREHQVILWGALARQKTGTTELPPTARTIEPFRKINAGTTAKQFLMGVGYPDASVGSSDTWYYELDDGSHVEVIGGIALVRITHYRDGGKHKDCLFDRNKGATEPVLPAAADKRRR